MARRDVKVKKVPASLSRPKAFPIELDRPRTMVFDLNAFCELEERYGTQENMVKTLQAGGFRTVRTFLWAGLIHEDENLTEKQVGKLIGMHNIEEISRSIDIAIADHLPEEEDDELKNEVKGLFIDDLTMEPEDGIGQDSITSEQLS